MKNNSILAWTIQNKKLLIIIVAAVGIDIDHKSSS
uniref:Uncharacterized protein n=1 Tax=Arundo donax TaxID=35708 RepID=A0A0A8ZE13_ARUDO